MSLGQLLEIQDRALDLTLLGIRWRIAVKERHARFPPLSLQGFQKAL